MIQKFWLLIAIWAFTALASCKPDVLEDCFVSNGPPRTREIELPVSPYKLFIHDNLNVVWHFSEKSWIQIEGGRNMISQVEIVQREDTLELRNKARCNWVRSYNKKIAVDLYSPHPKYIEIQGFGTIFGADTLKGSEVTIRQFGAAESKFSVDVHYTHLGFKSYGSLEVTGKADVAYYFTQGGGKLLTENLKVKELRAITENANDLYVWAEDSLYGEIRNNKNLIYKGSPGINIFEKKQGKAVKYE
jgi:hypothetical protein